MAFGEVAALVVICRSKKSWTGFPITQTSSPRVTLKEIPSSRPPRAVSFFELI
jgi:hypothetical protein